MAVPARPDDPSVGDDGWAQIDLADAAAAPGEEVLARLKVDEHGLGAEEAARRLELVGPNAVRTQRVRWWVVLGRQLPSALLLLLLIIATISFIVGDPADSMILLVSVGLRFVNEYRTQLAAT